MIEHFLVPLAWSLWGLILFSIVVITIRQNFTLGVTEILKQYMIYRKEMIQELEEKFDKQTVSARMTMYH